jgi:phage/plasmid-like protein (TIGR03299 family)
MAHLVESLMYVGEAPWHKLGKGFIVPPTLEEAIIAAGLNWKVGTKPLFTAQNEKVEAMATFRESDQKILGVVGPKYTPLQNDEAFKFFTPFIDGKEATIECAGSLHGGRKVFILAKINRDPLKIVGDDTVEKYILLSNSHDGTLAVRAGFTPIRVVCNNTLQLAHSEGTSQLLRIRHTKSVVENLEKVQEIMNIANASFEATAEQYRLLAQTDIDQKTLAKYVKIVFAQKIAEEGDAESKSRVSEAVTKLFETGRGMDLPGVRGTYWAAYNAVTEYIQYERGNNEATRLDQTWFGAGAQLNKKALQTAIVMVQAAA